MRLSGRILTDALEFALENEQVISNLVPIDSNIDFTIKEIELKTISVQTNSILLKLSFQYKMYITNIDSSRVVIDIQFIPNVGFNLQNVQIINY